MNAITLQTRVSDDTFSILADFFRKFMGKEVEITLKPKETEVSASNMQNSVRPGIHPATSDDMSWLDHPWKVEPGLKPMTRDEMYDRF